jgi:antitoxin ParD1/3/4
MAEGINVRFTGALQRFIQDRTGASGLYGSASEYIRDLVRRDYEREEQRKSHWLRHELSSGAEADDAAFTELNAEAIIAEAKKGRKSHGR